MISSNFTGPYPNIFNIDEILENITNVIVDDFLDTFEPLRGNSYESFLLENIRVFFAGFSKMYRINKKIKNIAESDLIWTKIIGPKNTKCLLNLKKYANDANSANYVNSENTYIYRAFSQIEMLRQFYQRETSFCKFANKKDISIRNIDHLQSVNYLTRITNVSMDIDGNSIKDASWYISKKCGDRFDIKDGVNCPSPENLKKLSLLRICNLAHIPMWINNCVVLESLEIGWFNTLNLKLETFSRLETLILVADDINGKRPKIELHFGKLSCLRELKLSDCDNINFDFSGLNNLEILDLIRPDKIDFDIGKNINLVDLRMDCVDFSENVKIANIHKLTNLENLSVTESENIPKYIDNLTTIRTLDLSRCRKINLDFKKFTNLTKLKLNNVQVEYEIYMPNVYKLTQLEKLELRETLIFDLPEEEEIARLPNLKTLDISWSSICQEFEDKCGNDNCDSEYCEDEYCRFPPYLAEIEYLRWTIGPGM